MDALYDEAVRDTIAALRGDRLAGRHRRRAAQAELRHLPGRRPRGLAPDGVTIPFADGHTRQLPRAHRRPVPLRDARALYLERPGRTPTRR